MLHFFLLLYIHIICAVQCVLSPHFPFCISLCRSNHVKYHTIRAFKDVHTLSVCVCGYISVALCFTFTFTIRSYVYSKSRCCPSRFCRRYRLFEIEFSFHFRFETCTPHTSSKRKALFISVWCFRVLYTLYICMHSTTQHSKGAERRGRREGK